MNEKIERVIDELVGEASFQPRLPFGTKEKRYNSRKALELKRISEISEKLDELEQAIANKAQEFEEIDHVSFERHILKPESRGGRGWYTSLESFFYLKEGWKFNEEKKLQPWFYFTLDQPDRGGPQVVWSELHYTYQEEHGKPFGPSLGESGFATADEAAKVLLNELVETLDEV